MSVNQNAVKLARAQDETPNKAPQAPNPGTHTPRRPTRLMEAASVRNHWHVKVDESVTPRDLKSPAFFGHVQAVLRVGDLIEVVSADGAWMTVLRVQASEAGSVRTAELHFWEFAKSRATKLLNVPEGYKVAFAGEQSKWRAVRETDNRILKDGFADEASACVWLVKHLAEMSIA